MRLFIFEWKKVFFSKKFLLLMLLLIIAVSLLFLRNVGFQTEIEREERLQIESLLDTAFGFSSVHRAILDDDPDDEEEHERMVINSNNVDILFEMRSLIASEDYQQKLAMENELYAGIEAYVVAGGEPLLPPDEMEHSMALNQKLMDEDIKPQHDSYSLALPNFMKQVIDLFISFGAIVIVVLVIGDKLSAEYENRTINLLFTQPLHKQRIITSKFISAFAIYIVITVILIAAAALVGWIFGEPGTFAYPLTAEINHAIYYMTIGEYIVLALILVSATILLIISLYMFFSLLFKQTLPTLFVLLITIVGGYAITAFIPLDFLYWINPFQYVIGQEAILFQNDRVWWQGLPVIVVLSVILFLVSRQKVKTSKLD